MIFVLVCYLFFFVVQVKFTQDIQCDEFFLFAYIWVTHPGYYRKFTLSQNSQSLPSQSSPSQFLNQLLFGFLSCLNSHTGNHSAFPLFSLACFSQHLAGNHLNCCKNSFSPFDDSVVSHGTGVSWSVWSLSLILLLNIWIVQFGLLWKTFFSMNLSI